MTFLPFVAEAAGSIPISRIPERTKHDVPQRQIGVIVAVDTFLVMHAMALRPLDQVPQPVWRPDVPVIDELGYTRNDHCD